MEPKCPTCPLAGACNAYQALCDNHAKRPDEYRAIIQRRNDAEPEYPPLLVQAANYAASTIAHVAAGMPKADDDEVRRRLAICEACESYDAAKKRCTACGCPVRRKSKRADSECPLHKW